MINTKTAGGIGKKALVAVSFGTVCGAGSGMEIKEIEHELARAFGRDFSVRRAFTSDVIIGRIRERCGIETDSVKAALCRAAADGVRTLVVQPTHLTRGPDCAAAEHTVSEYAGLFDEVRVGKPLLDREQDYADVASAIASAAAEYDDGRTAVCYVGHGAAGGPGTVCKRLQSQLLQRDCSNICTGMLKESPTLEDVLADVRKGGYRRVVLRPLMITSGSHADNDMAGDRKDSWKSRFEAAGCEVLCIMEGLGGIPAVRDVFVRHAGEAAAALTGGARRNRSGREA